MFKYCLGKMILGWAILVSLIFWIFYTPSPQARKNYRNLMELNDQTKKERIENKDRTIQQARYRISKQMLYKQQQHRLQARLTSESSELSFEFKNQKFEVVEHFKNMRCVFQEKLFYLAKQDDEEIRVKDKTVSHQFLRDLSAHDALYSYKTGELKAKSVGLTRYLLAGHDWVFLYRDFEPLFKGYAEQIEFSIFKKPIFKAQGFQAIIFDWENE